MASRSAGPRRLRTALPPRPRQPLEPVPRQGGNCLGPPIDKRSAASRLERRDRLQPVRQPHSEAGIHRHRAQPVRRAQRRGTKPQEPPAGILDMCLEIGLVVEPAGLHVPAARGDHRVKIIDGQPDTGDQPRQRAGHLVGPRHRAGAGAGLLDRLAPPLQPHFGDHRLGCQPRGARHFDVQRKDGEQPLARRRRRRHRDQEPIRITAAHQIGTGVDLFGGEQAGHCAGPSRTSFQTTASRSASNEASTMLALTPTVDQRRPCPSSLSMITRVTASVPPLVIRTL